MAAHKELPAVARRRVRLALRDFREGTGLSQAAVASRLSWSMSKLQRIEIGEVTISPIDLRAILDVYGVDDPGRVAALIEDARVARRERYWTAQDHREHLSAGLRQLVQFEAAAVAIRTYQSTLVAGPLQTPELAEAVLNWYDQSLTEDERRVRHRARLSRRQALIEGTDSPQFLLMIDESFLLRTVGSTRVTAEQFEDLARAAARPNVHVRVLPYDAGTFMSSFGYFTVVDLSPDDNDNAVLYRERYASDELVQDAAEVAFHRNVFERFWKLSLSEEASTALILARAYELRARLARAAFSVEDNAT